MYQSHIFKVAHSNSSFNVWHVGVWGWETQDYRYAFYWAGKWRMRLTIKMYFCCLNETKTCKIKPISEGGWRQLCSPPTEDWALFNSFIETPTTNQSVRDENLAAVSLQHPSPSMLLVSLDRITPAIMVVSFIWHIRQGSRTVLFIFIKIKNILFHDWNHAFPSINFLLTWFPLTRQVQTSLSPATSLSSCRMTPKCSQTSWKTSLLYCVLGLLLSLRLCSSLTHEWAVETAVLWV